jgi:hypothetical protein
MKITIPNYNCVFCLFVCLFVWVWDLVAQIAGDSVAEGFWKCGSEEGTGPRRDEVTRGDRNYYIMRSFMFCPPHQTLFA